MHIRIIHQYFKTPSTGGGLRTYYLARELVKRGYQVSIITATNEGRQNELHTDGFTIHYIPVYYSNHLGFYSRIHAFFRYIFLCIAKIRKLPEANINYVVTTPLTTGIIAMYEKLVHHTPYIFEVGDIWPEAPIQLRILRNPLLKALARLLERKSYKHADALVGLSGPITEHLRQFQTRKPIFTITNFSNPDLISAERPANVIRDEFGISETDFVLSYTGTIGVANHLEYLVDLARAIPEDWPVKIFVMGNGARKDEVHSYAQNQGTARIQFLPHGDQSAVAELLSVTHAMYISFFDVPVLGTGCPNKFFDALVTGKLIILNFNGWIRSFVEREEVGFYHTPQNPQALLPKLQPFVQNLKRLESIEKRGKRLAKEYFIPEIQMNPLHSYLLSKEKAG